MSEEPRDHPVRQVEHIEQRGAPERIVDDPARRPPVGQSGLVTLGLAIGLLLVTIQLWLLTIAFDLYLEGTRGPTVGVALWSGLVFLGGLLMLRLISRRPRRQR